MEWIRKYKAFILLMIGIAGIVIVNWDKLFTVDQKEVEEYSEILITTNKMEQLEYIMVDIKGEVLYPGLYEVSANQRIGDVINIAGGLTETADISSVNLASKLEDEMIIIIPKTTSVNSQTPNDIIKIIVEIKGEVINPGVYELYYNQRVSDLIQISGGLTISADISNISMVEILQDEAVIVIPKVSDDSEQSEQTIKVEIKGEVRNPGLYTMVVGDRVIDLIIKAGGLTNDAMESALELAQLLEDGQTIIIPRLEEEKDERQIYVQIHGEILHPGTYLISEGSTILDLIYLAGGVSIDCDLSKINWNISLCLGAVIYIPSFEDEELTPVGDYLININTADLETLMTLNGIGQIIGQRIIDYRAEYGNFLSIEDIMNVSGIKESIYEQIKEYITV